MLSASATHAVLAKIIPSVSATHALPTKRTLIGNDTQEELEKRMLNTSAIEAKTLKQVVENQTSNTTKPTVNVTKVNTRKPL